MTKLPVVAKEECLSVGLHGLHKAFVVGQHLSLIHINEALQELEPWIGLRKRLGRVCKGLHLSVGAAPARFETVHVGFTDQE